MSNNWIEEENERAKETAKTGQTTNSNAPRLVVFKKKVRPPRIIKNIYIQELYSRAFDKLVFSQKLQKGKTAPELAEEAIKLLIKKYKAEL